MLAILSRPQCDSEQLQATQHYPIGLQIRFGECKKSCWTSTVWVYGKISNIRCTISQTLNVSCLALHLSLLKSIEARYYVENEDVVGAAPTGDAPSTTEWLTIILPTRVHLILEALRYAFILRITNMYMYLCFIWLFNKSSSKFWIFLKFHLKDMEMSI